MCGCARRPDPFGRQVSRATDASLRGQELLSEGEDRRAEKAFTKSLEINRSIDNPIGTARQLNNLAAVALTRGDLAEAKNLFQQALFVNQGLGNDAGAAINLANLATIAQKDNDLPKAEALPGGGPEPGQALGLSQGQGAGPVPDGRIGSGPTRSRHGRSSPGGGPTRQPRWPKSRAPGITSRADCLLARGDTVKALSFFQDALAADRSILNRPGMGADLQGLGQSLGGSR